MDHKRAPCMDHEATLYVNEWALQGILEFITYLLDLVMELTGHNIG